jgi:hypothetical protein
MLPHISIDDRILTELQQFGELQVESTSGVPFVMMTPDVYERSQNSQPVITPATSDRAAAEAAVLALEDYDFDALREAREAEVRQLNGSTP